MKKIALAAFALLCSFAAAFAQTPNITGNEFQTQQAGKTVVGIVGMCVNASNVAVPCPSTGGAPSVSANQGTPNTIGNAWPTYSFGNYAFDSITQVTGITFTANTAWNNTGTQKFFTLTGACRVNGGEVLIPQIDIWSTANPMLKLTGILWLFAGVPSSNIANNASFALANADYAIALSKQGYPFTLGNVQATGAANSGTSLTGITYPGRCPAGTTTISGMIEVTNAYVSTTGEILNIGIPTVGVN